MGLLYFQQLQVPAGNFSQTKQFPDQYTSCSALRFIAFVQPKSKKALAQKKE